MIMMRFLRTDVALTAMVISEYLNGSLVTDANDYMVLACMVFGVDGRRSCIKSRRNALGVVFRKFGLVLVSWYIVSSANTKSEPS
jgi:hypothetical protein